MSYRQFISEPINNPASAASTYGAALAATPIVTPTRLMTLSPETNAPESMGKTRPKLIAKAAVPETMPGAPETLSACAQESTRPNVRISCPLLNPHPVKIVRPTYPALARQTHVEGRVSLNCLVGTDGLVEKIKVTKGHPLLIQAATDAVS